MRNCAVETMIMKSRSYNWSLLVITPIELSRLLEYFLQSSDENIVTTVIAGKRKHEVGLVIPAKYSAKDLPIATILNGDLLKIKTELYPYFELNITLKGLFV